MAEYNEIMRDINQGKYAQVYLLHGKEPFFINSITNQIEQNALDDSQKSFNQYILYGKETDMTQILATARKYPMMGERQVVIIKEAQGLAGWKADKQLEMLLSYVNNPLPSTILVFAYIGNLEKRKKIMKSLLEAVISFESKPIYDNQLPAWIQSYANARNARISTRAVHLLAENIGTNLHRLSSEIDKLMLNIQEGQEIDEVAVHKHVGISKEYNVFELQKALALMHLPKALRIARYFASNPGAHPLVVSIGVLYTYFASLLQCHVHHAYDPGSIARTLGKPRWIASEYQTALKNYNQARVLHAIEMIHQADLQAKGIGYNTSRDREGEILKELIFKIVC